MSKLFLYESGNKLFPLLNILVFFFLTHRKSASLALLFSLFCSCAASHACVYFKWGHKLSLLFECRGNIGSFNLLIINHILTSETHRQTDRPPDRQMMVMTAKCPLRSHSTCCHSEMYIMEGANPIGILSVASRDRDTLGTKDITCPCVVTHTHTLCNEDEAEGVCVEWKEVKWAEWLLVT